MWLEALTGLEEVLPAQVRENLHVDGEVLTLHVNGGDPEFTV